MLKSKLSGSQRCRWRYGYIFIRLAAVASQICANFAKKFEPIAVLYKVIDLGANRKCIMHYAVINSTFYVVFLLQLFHCILLYFSLFSHVFYRITIIGWSALAVVSCYCQILLLLLLILLLFERMPISYPYWDINAFSCKIACFPNLPLFGATARGETVRISGWNLPRKNTGWSTLWWKLRNHNCKPFFTARCTVCLFVCLSVTSVDCDHVGLNSSKIFSLSVSLGCSLLGVQTSRVYS